jgi:hypothetical protein
MRQLRPGPFRHLLSAMRLEKLRQIDLNLLITFAEIDEEKRAYLPSSQNDMLAL